MNLRELRRRAVGYLVVTALGGAAWWAVGRGAPMYARLRTAEAHLASLEATTRAARDHAVRSGGAGIEDSIAAARSRFVAVAELVPASVSAESDSDVRRLVAALAERNGVIVRSAAEGQAEHEGTLHSTSIRVSAEGPYHEVRRWLDAVESTRRLVRLRLGTLGARVDSSAVGPHGAAAEAPATVWFEGTFQWFRRDSSALNPDTTRGEVR
jgi:hypothetical protein